MMLGQATALSAPRLERDINVADALGLISADQLRAAAERFSGRPGVAALRAVLDRHTFTLTDSELERMFLPIARSAGLDRPLTRQKVNGFRVDFFWPTRGLVVETDGLRYHRTPAEQARDLIREQTHKAAGLEPLRFTHWQVAREKAWVERTLRRVVARRAEQRS
jgi:very-short-patch-repair endonuclease